MEIVELIDTLDVEGGRLVDAALRAGLDADVPHCPGWQVRQLLAHVAFVHGWAADYVGGAVTEVLPEPSEEEIFTRAPGDDAIADWALAQHRRLVLALRSAPADLACWTFLAAPSPLAMWSRRQAHETTIHRVDAEEAGRSSLHQIDADFARDGIDEILHAFLARRRPRGPVGPPRRTIALHDTDSSASWSIRLFDETLDVVDGPGDGDLVVRAGAADLYLWLWQRRELNDLDTTGSADAAEEFRRLSTITW